MNNLNVGSIPLEQSHINALKLLSAVTGKSIRKLVGDAVEESININWDAYEKVIKKYATQLGMGFNEFAYVQCVQNPSVPPIENNHELKILSAFYKKEYERMSQNVDFELSIALPVTRYPRTNKIDLNIDTLGKWKYQTIVPFTI